jgi:hypothetical protein
MGYAIDWYGKLRYTKYLLGNGYTTCRVTLAASDFSIKGYSYDDCPGVSQNCTDFNLTNFKLDELEDIAYKVGYRG